MNTPTNPLDEPVTRDLCRRLGYTDECMEEFARRLGIDHLDEIHAADLSKLFAERKDLHFRYAHQMDTLWHHYTKGHIY